jgi:hypothetical protein
MMTTLKITRIWIEHIDKIEVEDAKEFGLLGEWHEVSLRALAGPTADAVLAGV